MKYPQLQPRSTTCWLHVCHCFAKWRGDLRKNGCDGSSLSRSLDLSSAYRQLSVFAESIDYSLHLFTIPTWTAQHCFVNWQHCARFCPAAVDAFIRCAGCCNGWQPSVLQSHYLVILTISFWLLHRLLLTIPKLRWGSCYPCLVGSLCCEDTVIFLFGEPTYFQDLFCCFRESKSSKQGRNIRLITPQVLLHSGFKGFVICSNDPAGNDPIWQVHQIPTEVMFRLQPLVFGGGYLEDHPS